MLVNTLLAVATSVTAVSAVSIVPRQNSGSSGGGRGGDVPSPGVLGFSYPALRGFSAAAAGYQPCGGYKLMGRTEYPISGGQISFKMQKDARNVGVFYSLSANPQSIADFQPLLSSNISSVLSGEACLAAPDFSSLGATVGSPVTLMVNYQTGPNDSSMYQCADVNLIAAAAFRPQNVNVECRNYTLSTQTMKDSAALSVSLESSASAAASTASSSSSSSSREITSPGVLGFSYPALRGYNSAASGYQPCGGYKLMGRTEYPMSGGQISFKMQKDANTIGVFYSLSANPQSIADFQPLLPNNISRVMSGEACLTAPDFSTLGATVGSPVTLMVNYQTGPGNYSNYQCADVNLIPTAQFLPQNVNVECRNYTLSTQTMRDSAALSVSVADASQTGSAGSGASSSDSSSGLSKAAAGGIGAGVALGVFALVAAILFALGGRFSLKKNQSIALGSPSISRVHSDSTTSTFQGEMAQKV